MKQHILLGAIVLALSAVLMLPACQSQVASTTSATAYKSQHHHYRVVDVGTFGGPNGDVLVPPPAAQILTNSGIFVGAGETTISDSFAPNCFRTPECVVEEGLIRFGGTSIDLGTLGGNGASANAINDRGQIFGGALNTIPDTDSSFPFFIPGATQAHAVLWEHGAIKDLGTLGGTDSVVYQANESGQAMGISFTDNVRHDSTGLPTTHPFLWDRGKMHDVGSLGGTFSEAYGLNNRGEVVGFSFLDGDTYRHPFMWHRGIMSDLGTLGGNNGVAWAINNRGHIVGRADLPGGQTHHAFLQSDHQMIDLGTPHGNACSTGETINIFDQVVGDSGECGVGGDPFLWEKGQIVALSDLILPGSDRIVFDAFQINDLGEIVSLCATPEGNEHVCLLMPVQDEHLAAVQSILPLELRRSLPPTLPPTGERRIMMPTGREKGNSFVRTLSR